MTMRCLLDLSCIDPSERNPDDTKKPLWASGPRGRQIHQQNFLAFCQKYPRLVRRLREQLGYNANEVVNFLSENRDVPNRFSDKKTLDDKFVLKRAIDQFPILPPK